MNGLFASALGSLLRIAGVEHMRLAIHRYSMAAVLGVLSVFFILGAIVYGLGALWFAVLPRFGVILAYLIVGGGMLLISMVLALSAWIMTRSSAPAAPLNLPARDLTGPRLPALSGGAFAGNGMAGLASAVIAGFIVGLVRGKSDMR
jgi:hypothetical protein